VTDKYKLPKIPKTWKWAKIDDFCEVFSGQTPKGINNFGKDGEIPYFKVADMNREGNEKYMRKANIYLTKDEVNKLKIKIYDKGTIIFPKRGGAIATNKKRILIKPSAFDLNIMGIKSPILVEYLYYWISSINLASLSDGSNVPQINNRNIKPLYVPIPSLNEQKRIVEKIELIFTNINNSINVLKKVKNNLDIYRKSVLNYSFKLKEESKKISEYCEIISGSTPKTSLKEYWGGDILWITPKDLSGYNNKYIYKTNRTITKEGYNSCSTIIIPENNVLMSSRAPIGYLVINKKPMCTNQGFKSFKIINHGELNEEFLFYQLKHIIEYVKNSGSGTTFNEISKSKASNILIKVPDIKIQKQIVIDIESNFSIIDKLEETINQLLIKIQLFRISIMQKAFQGKLVQQNPLDESAELLLNRIKNEKHKQMRLYNE